jgi:surface protein
MSKPILMKPNYLIIFTILVFLTGLTELSAQDFYLHSNGVTCMCPAADVGDTGVVNGITYTKRSADQITNTNASTTCTSGIVIMTYLFEGNTDFNENISSWDVSNVIDMGRMFYNAESFNQDIGNWDVSNVIDISKMFKGAKAFNQDIGNWNVSSVTDMILLFQSAESFNQDIGNWDVSSVTDMNAMFSYADEFNQNIGSWDVTNVTNMNFMFTYAYAFNQDIGNWDVTNVTNMTGMFQHTQSFNQDIGNWNVSNVTTMDSMFNQTYVFNQDIGNWDMSNVTTVVNMFSSANAFNQDIGNWDVSNVFNMVSMFHQAYAFNQNIGNWQFNSDVSFNGFVAKSGLDVANYEALLQAFNNQNLTNKLLASNELYYCDDTARTNLITNKGWNIIWDTDLQSGIGIHVSCPGDAARRPDDIENTYTVLGDELDSTIYFCDANFNITNDYNNMPTLDGAVFAEGSHTINWTATNTNNDTSSCSFVLIVDPNLATVDFNSDSIILYPNPTNNIINLYNPQSVDLESLTIYDLTGRLIKNIYLKTMGTEISIDVSGYANGTYLMIVKSANNNQVSKKLVVIY